jgi:hypothetical protein
MSVEALKALFDAAAVVLLFLTFAAGFGVLVTGNIINGRQEEKLRKFDSDLTAAKFALATQQERAATLEVEALSLRMELLKQGARENLLVGAKRDKLIASLKPFAGQNVEVRYGLNPVGFLQHIPEPAGPDVRGVADSLTKVLQEAQWSLPSAPLMSYLQGPAGLTVQISPKASPSTLKAANALVKSLGAVPLGIQGPIPTELSANPRLGTVRNFVPDIPGGPAIERSLPPQTDETIVLVVLAHPK